MKTASNSITKKSYARSSVSSMNIIKWNGGHRVCNFIFLSCFIFNTASATVYYSWTTGTSPSVLGNWWINTNGTGGNPANFTTAADTFVVQAAHAFTSTADWTVTGNIRVSGILNFGAHTIAIGAAAGTARVRGTGSLNITSTTGTKTFNHIVVNSGTWNNSGNADIIVNGNIQNDGTFTCGSGIYTLQGGATKTISGTSGVTITNATIATTGVYTNSTTFTIGTLTINNPGLLTNNSTVIVNTSITGNAGGTLTQGANSTLNIGGTVATITLNASAVNNTVKYNKTTGAQTIFSSSLLTYYHLTIVKSAQTATFAANTTINGDFTITSGIASLGAFDITVSGTTSVTGTFNITSSTGVKTFGGIVVINSGGTWNNSGNSVIQLYNDLRNDGTFTSGSGNYNFGGTGYSILGTSGVTMTGALFVPGSLYFNQTTFTVGTLTLTLGDLYNDNILTVNTAITGTAGYALTQDAGSTLNIGGTIGIITLDASTNSNTVNYTSTTAGQTIFVPSSAYHHLTITKSAQTATLGGNITVNGVLTFTSGKLSLGANDLTIGNSGSISGATSAQYVVTNGAGKLIQNNIGSGGRTGVIIFPVGYSTSVYTPLTIDNSAGTADAYNVVACQYQHTDGSCSGSENIANVVRAIWQLNEAVAGGSNATVAVTWTAADEGTGFDNTNCGMATYSAGWVTPSSYSNASGTRTVSKVLTTMYPLSVRDGDNNMTYVSSTVLQTNVDSVLQASTRQEIICIRIYAEGAANPLDMDRFNFNTVGGNGTGTQDPANDLLKAEIFYTGSSAIFSTTNYYNKKNGPSGAFAINKPGAYLLSEGYNYFWLTYNIAPDAYTYNHADAQLVSLRVSGNVYSDMAVGAPVGKRPIKGASKYYAIGNGNINDATIWSWNLAGGGDNGPSCGCAPNGIGIVYIDTNYTVTLNTSREFDAMVIQQGALVNYSGANRNLRLLNYLNTEGTGRFQLDSINVLGDITLTGSGASTSNSFINADRDLTVGIGTSLTPGNNVTVGNSLAVNGTVALGTRTLTMDGGNNYEIEGRGSITGTNSFIVNAGSKLIGSSSTTNLTIQPPFSIQGAYTMTNKDSISLQGNLTGSIASSGWVNDTNAVLNVAGSLLATGTLTATSPGNTVNYNGAAQNIKTTTYHHLTVSGSATKTLLGSTAVNGNLTLSAGTLDASAGNYDIDLKGDWSNSATFIERSGTVTFMGTNAQTISNASADNNFYRLAVSNSNNVSLNNAINITNNLNFSSGKLLTGATVFTIKNGAIITGNDNSKYIVTDNVSGYLKMENITASTLFPVGYSTSAYTPTTLANSGTADNFKVHVCQDINITGTCGGSPTTDHVVKATWLIEEDVVGGSNATVTLQWNAADEGNLFDNTNCGIIHYTASAWDVPPSYVDASGTRSISRSSITSFSPFGAADGTEPLPIELLAFNAQPLDNSVLVRWSTASEWNSNYFVVQSSEDGILFEDILKVNAAGNSSTTKNYSAVDKEPYIGESYYRLRQVDNDGTFKYFGPIAVNFFDADESRIQIYPSVSSGTFFISGDFKSGQATVYSITGQTVLSKNIQELAANEPNKIEMANEPNGIYFLKVKTEGKEYTQKIILNH